MRWFLGLLTKVTHYCNSGISLKRCPSLGRFSPEWTRGTVWRQFWLSWLGRWVRAPRESWPGMCWPSSRVPGRPHGRVTWPQMSLPIGPRAFICLFQMDMRGHSRSWEWLSARAGTLLLEKPFGAAWYPILSVPGRYSTVSAVTNSL